MVQWRLPTIDDWDSIAGSRVLVRVDFNTPFRVVDGERVVADDFRIRAALPLFEELKSRGAHVVACTHVGRPKGHYVEQYTVEPVRQRLAELCEGVELMENLRFDAGEESNDEEFGRQLVKGFDYYVNEAFGCSHRAHASVMAPPHYLASAAGPNLLRETETLLGVFDEPVRPFVAVVGGAKVADKLAVTTRLLERADEVVIGGAMAFTFWRALGRTTGDSIVDESKIEECRKLLESGRVVLPDDVWALPTGASFGEGGDVAPTLFDKEIPDGWVGLDIGPESVARVRDAVTAAGTVLWNGPMGVFEDDRLASGTRGVAEAMAACAGTTIVGGGDSGAALARFGLESSVSFISTGGGASLELLELGDLPGLRALRECPWNRSR